MHEKIVRVIEITRAHLDKSSQASILDLGCGSGLYALEACRQFPNVSVTGVDARVRRMSKGIISARNEGLDCTFLQADVRDIIEASSQSYDIVYCLGILYHFDFPDSLHVLKNLQKITNTLIIDTHISLNHDILVKYHGMEFAGEEYREHPPGATSKQKVANPKASIDNEVSFWYTKSSLLDALVYAGFTSVYQCLVPLEPNKPKNRITLVARI